MKLTFERNTFGEILDDLNDFMAGLPGQNLARDAAPTKLFSPGVSASSEATALPPGDVKGPSPSTEEKTEEPVEDKMAGLRAAKAAKAAKKAADEAAEKAKIAEEKAAVAAAKKAKPKTAKAEEPKEEPKEEPEPKSQPSPAEMVAIRTKTVAELQTAYANGKHAEVLELLAKYGNGAKSFRELTPEAFVPIREALDAGALT